MPISSHENHALWKRIQSFEFEDSGEQLTFAQRLARENGWSNAFTRRAIDEYRKFMFLAVTAGHPVTPSDEVDQVWHLHLVYTRSYWLRWCKETLQDDIHHGPTKGGQAERAKYKDWYVRTKASYARVFDEEPPPEFWPSPERRFGNDVCFQRVNVAQNWVFPRARAGSAMIRMAISVVGIMLVVGCATQLGEGSDRGDTILTIVMMVGLCAVFYLIWQAIRSGGGKGGGRENGGGWFNWGCDGSSDRPGGGDDSGCGGGCGD